MPTRRQHLSSICCFLLHSITICAANVCSGWDIGDKGKAIDEIKRLHSLLQEHDVYGKAAFTEVNRLSKRFSPLVKKSPHVQTALCLVRGDRFDNVRKEITTVVNANKYHWIAWRINLVSALFSDGQEKAVSVLSLYQKNVLDALKTANVSDDDRRQYVEQLAWIKETAEEIGAMPKSPRSALEKILTHAEAKEHLFKPDAAMIANRMEESQDAKNEQAALEKEQNEQRILMLISTEVEFLRDALQESFEAKNQLFLQKQQELVPLEAELNAARDEESSIAWNVSEAESDLQRAEDETVQQLLRGNVRLLRAQLAQASSRSQKAWFLYRAKTNEMATLYAAFADDVNYARNRVALINRNHGELLPKDPNVGSGMIKLIAEIENFLTLFPPMPVFVTAKTSIERKRDENRALIARLQVSVPECFQELRELASKE